MILQEIPLIKRYILPCFNLAIITLITGCGTLGQMRLNELTEVKEDAYLAQLPKVKTTAKAHLVATNKMTVNMKRLTLAPLVAHIDFQNDIKLPDGSTGSGGDQTWWDVEHGKWGFEYSVNNAHKKIGKALEKKVGSYFVVHEETEKKMSSNTIGLLGDKPDLNKNLPSRATIISYKNKPAFSAKEALEVAQVALRGNDSVMFFPYVYMTFKKQNASLTKMHDEIVINYETGINGYFILCNKINCVTAAFPNIPWPANPEVVTYAKVDVPMAYLNHLTSMDNLNMVSKFTQEFIGDIASELTMVAFDKLATVK